MKSPASSGLKVDGTMQYVPGGNRNRQVTSLRFMKALERPTDRVYLKKSVSSGFGNESGSRKKYIANPRIIKTDLHMNEYFISLSIKNLKLT